MAAKKSDTTAAPPATPPNIEPAAAAESAGPLATLEADYKAAQEAEWKLMEELAPATAKRQDLEDKLAKAKEGTAA